MSRTALLIRCEPDEADRIRVEAHKAHRTISDYVLRTALLFSEFQYPNHIMKRSGNAPVRTAMLVRCDVAEAERIRTAARRNAVPINAFVLHALKSSWNTSPNVVRRQ